MRSCHIVAVSAAAVVLAQNETLTCSTWLLGEEFGVARPHHGNIERIWNELWRPMVRYCALDCFTYVRSVEQEAKHIPGGDSRGTILRCQRRRFRTHICRSNRGRSQLACVGFQEKL
jgi:hypothetical protein